MNHVVSRNAYIDRLRCESVNTLSPQDIIKLSSKIIADVIIGFALMFDKGEVISDARGEGTLQFGVE